LRAAADVGRGVVVALAAGGCNGMRPVVIIDAACRGVCPADADAAAAAALGLGGEACDIRASGGQAQTTRGQRGREKKGRRRKLLPADRVESETFASTRTVSQCVRAIQTGMHSAPCPLPFCPSPRQATRVCGVVGPWHVRVRCGCLRAKCVAPRVALLSLRPCLSAWLREGLTGPRGQGRGEDDKGEKRQEGTLVPSAVQWMPEPVPAVCVFRVRPLPSSPCACASLLPLPLRPAPNSPAAAQTPPDTANTHRQQQRTKREGN
jgi:hypothetical protein